MFRLFLLALTAALALSAAFLGTAVPITPGVRSQAVAALMVGDGAGVDATVRAAVEAERRACRAIAADRPWTACEVR